MDHLKNKRSDRIARFGGRLCRICAIALLLAVLLAVPAMASGGEDSGPLQVLNNLTDFVFSGIRAIGIIVLGWGVVQIGMSIQSHDPSQRSQGFLCAFGGLIITFAREILTLIGVSV